MKKLIASMFLALIITSCTDESSTIRTLQASGFTDIKTTGHNFWACSDDDEYSTGFIATNPLGQRVSGTVCCGLFKNCTVRF
jgi:hypothetical protein